MANYYIKNRWVNIIIIIPTTQNHKKHPTIPITVDKLSALLYGLTDLAVVDIMTLCTTLLKTSILFLFEYDIRKHNSIVCKIHIWGSFWTDYTSTWLLVAVTLERCVSVWFPHKVKLIFTKHKTYIIIVSIMVFMALLSSHFLYGVGLNVKTTDNETVVDFCDFISQSYSNFQLYIWPWIDYCFYNVLPAIILVFCNIAIIYRVNVSSQHILRNESSNDNAI